MVLYTVFNVKVTATNFKRFPFILTKDELTNTKCQNKKNCAIHFISCRSNASVSICLVLFSCYILVETILVFKMKLNTLVIKYTDILILNYTHAIHSYTNKYFCVSKCQTSMVLIISVSKLPGVNDLDDWSAKIRNIERIFEWFMY